jgi:hypothetical protein
MDIDNVLFIKIYGERNTGTNYLEKLIKINFDVTVLPGNVPKRIKRLRQNKLGDEPNRDLYFFLTQRRNLGWKHKCVNPQSLKRRGSGVLFITLTKNPYSWLLSLYNRPYHNKRTLSFSDFLRSEWKTVGREDCRSRFPNPIELWNTKNGAYISLARELRTECLRYEDLLRNPESILRLLSERYGVSRFGTEYENVVESTKGDGKDYTYFFDYYLNEKWLSEYEAPDIAHINGLLDPEVLSFFGYQLLDPTVSA